MTSDESTDELRAELESTRWTKSSLSGSSGGNCLFAARLSGDRYAIRDSEQPDVPPMILRGSVFRAFVGGAKLGEFDF
ncbi:DUF397 domain-containing protein [Actinomadura sp. ATCC 31491]|uniref:DUF397 domain-containing protein n=1 Tax=Actinomadura luzonensis TaxID=2805427 RepID=A0ABT0FNX0_9ACTN|nr:DUF397 domain-containing protein [Actinomadura luzonensis]MCK2213858.1 DUF397 domain-containing protein [Actinomadura luzonensis]